MISITEVLRPENLHECVCFLDAASLARAATSSRLLVSLTDEAQRRPQLESAIGELKTVVGKLMPKLTSRPNMAIVFTNDMPEEPSSAFTEVCSLILSDSQISIFRGWARHLF